MCGVHGAVRYQPVQDRGAYAVVNAAGAAPEDDADEFTRTLRARQAAAMGC